MAPKEPYKVHSLSKHIADTNKGLSAEAQYNRRPVMKAAASIKQEAGAVKKSIFGANDDSDDDTSDSDSSSDEGGSDFLRKLAAPAKNATASTVASKRRSKDGEIADSDVERTASAKKAASKKKSVPVKPEPEP